MTAILQSENSFPPKRAPECPARQFCFRFPDRPNGNIPRIQTNGKAVALLLGVCNNQGENVFMDCQGSELKEIGLREIESLTNNHVI